MTCHFNRIARTLASYAPSLQRFQYRFRTPPPCCAVGVSPLLSHTPSPVEVTCILCQEETKDFASQERTFVQAVHVQRSSVLRRCQAPDSSRGRVELVPFPEPHVLLAE